MNLDFSTNGHTNKKSKNPLVGSVARCSVARCSVARCSVAKCSKVRLIGLATVNALG